MSIIVYRQYNQWGLYCQSINQSINRLCLKRGARDSSETDDSVARFKIKLKIYKLSDDLH